MLHREHIELRQRGHDDLYSYRVVADEEVTYVIESPKGFSMFFKEHKYLGFSNAWHEKKSQGRVVRETTEVDRQSSNHFLKNHKLHDDVRSFVLKGRLQLLPCHSLLHVYYPQTYDKRCSLCHHPTETISHSLNGCTRYTGMYQARHNRVVDILENKLASKFCNVTIMKDKILKPCHFDQSSTDSFVSRECRPDIVMIDNENRKVFIIEVSVPFDAHMNLTYRHKFDKYIPLSLEVNNYGYHTQVIVLIVGSLGNVHSRFKSGLKIIGLPKYETNFLANYCSISAILGSRNVWNRRCRDVHSM